MRNGYAAWLDVMPELNMTAFARNLAPAVGDQCRNDFTAGHRHKLQLESNPFKSKLWSADDGRLGAANPLGAITEIIVAMERAVAVRTGAPRFAVDARDLA